MTTEISYDDAIGDRLKPIASDGEWSSWEHRTLNMHRVVLVWRPSVSSSSAIRIGEETREYVRSHFRASWWRGLGFGLVIELEKIDSSTQELTELVDTVQKRNGTWQWVIARETSSRTVLGVHTWVEGYLSPVYRNVMSLAAAAGFECASVKKDKGRFLSAITEAANFATRVRSLGMREAQFREFDDEL